MSDEKFTYTVREEIKDGEVCYYATFADGNGMLREADISYELYLAMEDCRRHEQRQVRSEERHRERLALSEGQLAKQMAKPSKPFEDCIILAADMQAALALLTPTQKRRFLLHHELGLSFEQIAQAESRYKSTIAESITAATEKLKNFFSCNPDERGSECGID